MKLKINTRLWNKFDKINQKKPKILLDIEKNNDINGNRTYTNTGVEFFERLRVMILTSIQNQISESWEPITQLSHIEHGDTPSEFIAYLLKDDGTVISDIIIAYGDKAGNTLISQQINTFILDKIDSEKNISYLYDKGIKKILYLTYDLNQKPYASTTKQVIRSLASLEFLIVEMFPSSGHDFSKFTDAQQAFDSYKNSQISNPSVEIQQVNGKLLLKKNNDTPFGSGLYMFSILLLAYYKLSHPELGFDSLQFYPEDRFSNVDSIQYLNSIFDGTYYRGEFFQQFDITKYNKNEINMLIYGAPGTGKSFFIENKVKPNYQGSIERVTFYGDFDYTDFVGGLKPTRDENNQINYTFVTGPFTRVLIDAYNNPDDSHLLIIEELNRANAASVFGDIFQLLDRNESGISKYEIFNSDLASYLNKEVIGFTQFQKTGIKLPGNMAIYATMNPADQGVQQIDSAFKRRWNMKYLPINFDSSEDNIGDVTIKGFNQTWRVIGKGINSYLVTKDVEEDARLGQHFLTKEELQNIKDVSSKLLGYLWNDALPYQRAEVFKLDTLAEVISRFEELESDTPSKLSDIFSENFLEVLMSHE